MSKYQLTPYERETYINFDEADPFAYVYTHNKKLQKQMDRQCREHSQSSVIHKDEWCGQYKVFKENVTVRYIQPYCAVTGAVKDAVDEASLYNEMERESKSA